LFHHPEKIKCLAEKIQNSVLKLEAFIIVDVKASYTQLPTPVSGVATILYWDKPGMGL